MEGSHGLVSYALSYTLDVQPNEYCSSYSSLATYVNVNHAKSFKEIGSDQYLLFY